MPHLASQDLVNLSKHAPPPLNALGGLPPNDYWGANTRPPQRFNGGKIHVPPNDLRGASTRPPQRFIGGQTCVPPNDSLGGIEKKHCF